MPRLPAALAILLALVLAVAGCGSDDDDAKSGGSADTEKTEKAEKGEKTEKTEKTEKANGSEAPKKASARAKLVDCIEGEGLEISYEGDDPDKATNYTVGPDDAKRRKALIEIHSNRGDASSSAERKGLEKGLNAVAFGRAEFIRYEATDTEAGHIVGCMSQAYGG